MDSSETNVTVRVSTEVGMGLLNVEVRGFSASKLELGTGPFP